MKENSIEGAWRVCLNFGTVASLLDARWLDLYLMHGMARLGSRSDILGALHWELGV